MKIYKDFFALRGAFFALMFFFTQISFGHAIIFDMGGVLVDTHGFTAFKEVGFGNFGGYVACNIHKLHAIKKHIQYQALFKLLHAVRPAVPGETPARDESGQLLPQIMCDWIKGTSSNKQVLDEVHAFIDTNPNFFNGVVSASCERALLKEMTAMMFTPERFVKTRVFHPEMVAFAQECYAAGHRLYILSNWDAETFSLLRTQNAAFFDLFDGIVLSGQEGVIKPGLQIYQRLLERYNLDARECIFIDDRPENIAAAAQVGIHGILCQLVRVGGAKFWAHKPDVGAVRYQVNTRVHQLPVLASF